MAKQKGRAVKAAAGAVQGAPFEVDQLVRVIDGDDGQMHGVIKAVRGKRVTVMMPGGIEADYPADRLTCHTHYVA